MRGFLVGTVLGAVAAILVAPMRGEETRVLLRSRADEWQDQIVTRVDQARSEIESMRSDVMARLDEMRAQFSGPRAEPGMVTPPPTEEGSTPPSEEM